MKTPEPPPSIPGFQIHRVIGEGASGTVYLATQESLGREVALKVLKIPPGSSSARHRFRREAQSLAGMSHPRVMRVIAYHEAEPCWMALEYLPGGSLADRIREGGTGLAVEEVQRLAIGLLAAAEALHAARLVHRDIKPANVLYRVDGAAVLGDLGLVSEADHDHTRLTGHGAVIGTLAYLAPEVAAGGEHTPQSDLFAIGVTLYEAATGRHPVDHFPISAGFRATDPLALRPELPAKLARLLQDLIDPDPARRPRSARESLAALKSGSGKVRRISRLRRAPTLLLGSSALILLVALCAVMFRPGSKVTVTVRAGIDCASIRVKAAAPEMLLCVFDSAGKLHQGYAGVVEAGETRFEIDHLQPGTAYRGQLVSRSRSSPPHEGDIAIRTAAKVEVLGVDAAEPPGIWVRVSPPARAGWTDAPDTVPVDATAHRVPIPGGANRLLELTFGPAATARLSVGLGPRPPTDRQGGLLPIGVIVPALGSRVSWHGVAQSLENWLVSERVSWVVVNPRSDGTPNVDARTADALWRRAGISTMYMLGTTPPATSASAPDLLASVSPGGHAILAMDPAPLNLVDHGDGLRDAPACVAAWRKFLARRSPALDVVVPLPSVFLYAAAGYEGTSFEGALRLGSLGGVEMQRGLSSTLWGKVWDEARLHFDKAGVKVAVRWVWTTRERRQIGGILRPIERHAAATSLVLARARFPGSIALFHIEDLADVRMLTQGPAYQLGPSADDLIQTARSLCGQVFQRELGPRTKAPPWLDHGSATGGFAFSGDGRHVQVLTAPRPPTARFRPSGPGTLRVAGSVQTLLTTAQVELPTPDATAIFEELRQVEVTFHDGAPAQVSR